MLVDVKHHKLIDSATSLAVNAINSNTPSISPLFVKLGGTTRFDALLKEFKEITHPIYTETAVKHSVTHRRIETRGPLVAACPHCLAPDRPNIAKAEFDHMLELGIVRSSSSNWSSSLHMVLKKMPSDWRSCGND